MKNETVRLLLFCSVIVFLSFGLIFRKRIAYMFCPLEKYTGKVNRGKSHYFIVTHFIVSVALTIVCFALLNDMTALNLLFEDIVSRLLAILLIWFSWIYLLGLLIETYLQLTDNEYKDWKKKFLTK